MDEPAPAATTRPRDGRAGLGVGCLVALVAIAALYVLGYVSITQWSGNPDVIRTENAQALGPITLLAVGAGVARALRRKWIALGLAAFALMLAAGPALQADDVPYHYAYPPPTPEELAPPGAYVIDGVPMWIHPVMALELRAPEGLEPVPAAELPPLASEEDAESALITWAWRSPGRERTLVITLSLTVAYDDPASDRLFVASSMREAIAGLGPAGMAVVEHERRGPNEEIARVEHETAGAMFVRLIAYRHGDVIIMATAMASGRDHEQLVPFVESIRGRPEHTSLP